MVAVTYGVARVAAPDVAAGKIGKKRKGFFARVFDAIAVFADETGGARTLALSRSAAARFRAAPQPEDAAKKKTPFGGW